MCSKICLDNDTITVAQKYTFCIKEGPFRTSHHLNFKITFCKLFPTAFTAYSIIYYCFVFLFGRSLPPSREKYTALLIFSWVTLVQVRASTYTQRRASLMHPPLQPTKLQLYLAKIFINHIHIKKGSKHKLFKKIHFIWYIGSPQTRAKKYKGIPYTPEYR